MENWNFFYKNEKYVGVIVIKQTDFRLLITRMITDPRVPHSDTELRPMLRSEGM